MKIPTPYVNAIMDNRQMIGDQMPKIDISTMQNFISDYNCDLCGNVGKFWILDKYVDGQKNLQRKTVFTFQNQNGGDCDVANPINELVVSFSGDGMIDLAFKQLESNKLWYMPMRTTSKGSGIIMWGLNSSYKVTLPLFDFNEFNYQDLKTLLNRLKLLFNGQA